MSIATYQRKAQNINASTWISLPKPWTETHDITKGDNIKITLEADGSIKIWPPQEENK